MKINVLLCFGILFLLCSSILLILHLKENSSSSEVPARQYERDFIGPLRPCDSYLEEVINGNVF
jgi:hypothetical protein